MENLKLDIVLKDTPIEYGLDRESIVELYDKLGESSIEVYPIEIPAQYHECSAMGFITVDAADQLDYDYETSLLWKTGSTVIKMQTNIQYLRKSLH